MRKIIAISVLAICSSISNAQTDFFGGLAPSKKNPIINLPNKPNKIDEQGRKQGEWAKKYPNGRYMYVAKFVDNKPVDTLKRYSDNGNLSMYQIFYPTNDSCHVVVFNENGGKESEGNYYREQKDGIWHFFDVKGNIIAKTPYSMGYINGASITYYPTGEVLDVIHYEKDVQHGDWTRYYKSGAIQIKASYYKGKQHGHYKVINDNGDVSIEGVYNQGKQIGEWKVLDIDTRKHVIMKYDNNGNLLNKDELDKRNQERLDYYEKNRHTLEDPALQINDPSSYGF